MQNNPAWCNVRYLNAHNIKATNKELDLACQAYLYSLCATLILQNDKLPESKKHTFQKPDYLELLSESHDKKTDFDACAFMNHQTQEIIIAFAGTNSFKDWMANLIPFYTKRHYIKASEFTQDLARQHPNKRFIATGYSLGGALSIYTRKKLPHLIKEAWTFNASPHTTVDRQKDKHIYLLSTYNEALRPLRWLKRVLCAEALIKENRCETYNLIKGTPFENHQPWVLTRTLLHYADYILKENSQEPYNILQDSYSVNCSKHS